MKLDNKALDAIKVMKKKGLSYTKMSPTLKDMGYHRKNGRLLDQADISKFCCANGLRTLKRGRNKKTGKIKLVKNHDDVSVFILKNQTLSKKQKLKMLEALL